MRTVMSPRPISPQEREVLCRALEACATADTRPIHRALVETLVVTSTCECGCDTVEFRNDIGNETTTVVADGLGETPDGRGLGVIVFGTAHAITCLEVYSFDDVPAKLPKLNSIRPFVTG